MRPVCLLVLLATRGLAAPFECTIDGAPWKVGAPRLFTSDVGGTRSLYVNIGGTPSVSFGVPWALVSGPGKRRVELREASSDAGSRAPPLFGNVRLRPPVTPVVTAKGAEPDPGTFEIVQGAVEWEATSTSSAHVSFELVAARADGKQRVTVRCQGRALAWSSGP